MKELLEIAFRRVEVDSRKVEKGDLFFALKGEKVDGHAFLQEIALRGARAAVVDEGYKGESFGLHLIRVPDVLLSLQLLAKDRFSNRKSKVVAVTGSVGKTTTKEFIATLLEAKYKVAKTPGNANSQIGLPMALLNTPEGEEVFVIEMSMNGKGHIEKLVQIAPPDKVVITKIGMAHIGWFPDGLEGIAAAKAEIFSSSKTELAIVPLESMQFAAIEQNTIPKVLFSINDACAEYFLDPKKQPLCIQERQTKSPFFSLPFTETHLCEDFLVAAALARSFGLSWEEIEAQVSKLKPYKLRFEKIEKNGIVYINDCYNANPTSMQAALTHIPEPKEKGKKIAILGQMAELGAFSESAHREVAELALESVDHLICFGKECSPMVEVFQKAGRPVDFFTDFSLLEKHTTALAKPGDVVLIKGSNSNNLWRLLESS